MRIKCIFSIAGALIMLIMAILSYAFLSGCRNTTTKTLRIALILPFSGRTEASAIWAKRGAETAIAEINNRGGAAGYRFELHCYDDKSRPLYAQKLMEKAVTTDKADFFMGAFTSDVAMKLSEGSLKHKMIFIGTAHGSSITGIEYFQPYYFNVRKNSYQITATAAMFLKDLKKTRPWHKLSYIGPDDTFGHQSLAELLGNLKRYQVGYRMVSTYWPKLYTRDYKSYILNIMNDHPDLLIIDLYAGDLRFFTEQAEQLGLFAQIRPCNFVSGGHYDNQLPPHALPLGMYVSGSSFVNWPETTLHKKLIGTAYRQYHAYPGAMFQDHYNAVQILAEAVKKTGNPRATEAMVKALETMKFKTVNDPEGCSSYFDRKTHQLAQYGAVGELMENNAYPPARQAPGRWHVYPAELLLPPAQYILERREKAVREGLPVLFPKTATNREKAHEKL